MELVLSLDGAASFPIRLTGRIAPAARSMAWRVPALPTEHARLALRAGSGEEADSEELLFLSEPFAIDAPPGVPGEDLFPVNEEWRTREALEGAPVRPVASHLEAGGSPPNLEPLDLHAAELETGPADFALPNLSRVVACACGPDSSPEGRRSEASFRASPPLRL